MFHKLLSNKSKILSKATKHALNVLNYYHTMRLPFRNRTRVYYNSAWLPMAKNNRTMQGGCTVGEAKKNFPPKTFQLADSGSD